MATIVSFSKLVEAKVESIQLKYNNLAYNFKTVLKDNELYVKFNIIGQTGKYYKQLNL